MSVSLHTSRCNDRISSINAIADAIALGTKLSEVPEVEALSIDRKGPIAVGFSKGDLLDVVGFYGADVAFYGPRALTLVQKLGQLKKKIAFGDCSKGILDSKAEITQALAPISKRLNVAKAMVALVETELRARETKPVAVVKVEETPKAPVQAKKDYRAAEDWKKAWLAQPGSTTIYSAVK
jgi:hypothetical protein